MEPYLGQIQAFGFNFNPRGWAFCDGALLAISQNQALFSLLGTQYGGDGRTTFGLPDLRGRSMVHQGQGPGLSNVSIGQKGGSETTTLTVNNLPPHNHSAAVEVNTGNGEESKSTGYIASHASAFSESPAQGANLAGVTQNIVGGGQSFNNRSPYTVVSVCIALVGIFPSRN